MKRNKSTRVINQEVENSRATILKDIVEKLRSAKKVNHSEEEDDHTNEVFKRIAHLERMVRGMRNWSTSRVYKSYVHPSPASIGLKPHEWSPVDVGATEEDELVKQFMEEIQIIRK
jgi:hypothetical protein